jgi:hypothetical protein
MIMRELQRGKVKPACPADIVSHGIGVAAATQEKMWRRPNGTVGSSIDAGNVNCRQYQIARAHG